MSIKSDLVESHAHEYTARLKHIDSLFARSRSGPVPDEVLPALTELQAKRDFLEADLRSAHERLNAAATANDAQLSPLTIWDSVAAELEKLIERLQR